MPITVKMQHIFNGKFTNNHKMGLLCNESNILGGKRRASNSLQHPEEKYLNISSLKKKK